MLMTQKQLLLIGLILGLSACSTEDNPEPPPVEQKQPPANITKCEEPRPQICTREYKPVCATVNSAAEKTQKTYPSGCTACSDEVVIEYVEGAC